MSARKPNKSGGGAKTNLVGLLFERAASLEDVLTKSGYSIKGNEVYKNNKCVAMLYPKNDLYKLLLAEKGIDYRKILSKRLLPDQAILVGNTMYIIEVKYQAGSGSVDEKLQTSHFKKMHYTKLLAPAGITVEFIYILNDWFKQDQYRDVLAYVKEMGCSYHFNELPLNLIGL